MSMKLGVKPMHQWMKILSKRNMSLKLTVPQLEDDGQLAGTDKECYELLKQLKSQSALLDSKCHTKAGSELLVKDDISDEGDASVTSGKKILTLSALFEKLQRKSIISQASVLSEMMHLVIALREGPGCDGEYIKSHRSSVASIVHSYLV